MTPHELNLCIEVYNERSIVERNERTTLFYMAAFGDRIKRPPSLDKMLVKLPTTKRMQSDDEMLAMVKRMNARLGGEEVMS